MIEARVRFRHRGCYSEALVPGTRVMHLSGDSHACVATVQGPPEGVAAALREMASWIGEAPEVIDEAPGFAVVRCTCPRVALAPQLTRLGATVVYPVLHTGGFEWWSFLVPDRRVLAAVVARLNEEGRAEVERVADADPARLGVAGPLADAFQGLSEKQAEALRLAIKRGYYEQPRRTTIAVLAREMDCARSTFQEHLAKAERIIMSTLASRVVDDPALAALPQRRAGRPRAQGSISAKR